MSIEFSHLKARYCRAVLSTAAISPHKEARHLIGCLTTEPPTRNLPREVQIAERDALASILTLQQKFESQSAAAVAAEWKIVSEAVLKWINAAKG